MYEKKMVWERADEQVCSLAGSLTGAQLVSRFARARRKLGRARDKAPFAYATWPLFPLSRAARAPETRTCINTGLIEIAGHSSQSVLTQMIINPFYEKYCVWFEWTCDFSIIIAVINCKLDGRLPFRPISAWFINP